MNQEILDEQNERIRIDKRDDRWSTAQPRSQTGGWAGQTAPLTLFEERQPSDLHRTIARAIFNNDRGTHTAIHRERERIGDRKRTDSSRGFNEYEVSEIKQRRKQITTRKAQICTEREKEMFTDRIKRERDIHRWSPYG